MTKEELIKKMKEIAEYMPDEEGHIELDDLLLEYICDEEITNLFNSIEKWHA